MKKIKYILLFLLVLIFTGCVKKDVPFFELQEGKLEKDYKKTFENPVFFYTQNENGDREDLEGVEFVNNPMKIIFSNWKMSKPDKEGYVELSYDSTYDVDIEIFAKPQNKKWYYSFTMNSPMLYDYYTGEIYKTNNVTEGGTRSYQNGALTESKEEYKYTDVAFNGKLTKIGIYTKSSKRNYSGTEKLGKEEDKYHYKDHAKVTVTTYIRMPKDYRGVVLVVNKKGADESLQVELSNNSKKLKEIEEKYGKDSKEVKEIEKESDIIHKLVDNNDEVRKKFTINDYYHIRLANVYNIKEPEKTNYKLIIIIVISVVVFLSSIFIIIVNKKKKSN